MNSLWSEHGSDEAYESYRINEYWNELRGWVDYNYFDQELRKYLDPDFQTRFRREFYARLWELELAQQLKKLDFEMIPTLGKGPDFQLLVNGITIWIEAKVVLPDEALDTSFYARIANNDGRTFETPTNQYALRYTSSLWDKVRAYKKYLAGGLVSQNDICLIALSSFPPNSMHTDIEHFIRAIAPVGNLLVHFLMPNDQQAVAPLPTHDTQYGLRKTNGQVIPQDFLFPGEEFSYINGVLFTEASNLQMLLGSSNTKFDVSTNSLHLIDNYTATQTTPMPQSFGDKIYHHTWTVSKDLCQLNQINPVIVVK